MKKGGFFRPREGGVFSGEKTFRIPREREGAQFFPCAVVVQEKRRGGLSLLGKKEGVSLFVVHQDLGMEKKGGEEAFFISVILPERKKRCPRKRKESTT